MKFEPGFYKHFKGGIYLAHGIGEFIPRDPKDVLHAIAKDSEDLGGVEVYKREGSHKFVPGCLGSVKPEDRGLQYVVYQALYGEGSFWVRSYAEFIGNKDMGHGEGIKRFLYLGKELPENFFAHFERYSQ
ncbi:hypothetical protein CL619_05235 [archaeon]|nr:hypothetical protein [archaeon]|tara:strand:- start:1383 stop:1772 length:390 start_codon:yes stop_codon:yes gene_type:complete